MSAAEAESRGLPTDGDLVDRQAVLTASSAAAGMTLFVASEAVFFAAFLGIYASSYADAKNWPPVGLAAPSLWLPAVGVVVLLLTAASMWMSLRTLPRPDYPQNLGKFLGVTLAGAIVFMVLVVVGLVQVDFGMGDGIYQTLFYVLLGLELAHAVGGVALLGLVCTRAWTGELALRKDPVQVAAIYWFFVVGLGVVLFAVLYLAGAA
jgi:heme/copper-type cytochrome/quinol oxidase subunit 3